MFYKPLNTKGYEQKHHKLSEKCPWAILIDNGIVKNKGNSYTCAYEFIAPDIASSSRNRIDYITTMFNNSLINLGENWTVQVELQRRINNKYPTAKEWTSLTGMLIDRQREINYSYQKSHFHNHYFLIFTKKCDNVLEKKAKQIFVRKTESKRNIRIEEEVQSEIQEINDFKNKAENSVSILRSVMQVDFLDSDQLLTLLHSQVSMNWHEIKAPKDSNCVFLDRFITDQTLENSIPLKIGDYYCPVVSIKGFPNETFSAMLDAMNQADCEFRWSTRFMNYSKEETLKRLENAERRFHGQLQSIGQMVMSSYFHIESTRVNHTAAAKENEATQAKIDVSMGNIGFGDYCSTVMVWDKDINKAKNFASYISNLATACGFTTVIESINSLSAWASMMAGNIYANQRELFISTENLAHSTPFSSIWVGEENNRFMKDICGEKTPHIICDTKYGIPFYLNLNVADVGHTWVSGKTGYGKSTLLAAMEAQWLKYPGAQVIIFDKNKSARNLTICAGGTYVEPGIDKITFQPLAELESRQDQNWAAEFIELLLIEQKVNINTKMREAIFETIKLLSTKEPDRRTLTSFQQYCDYEDPVTHVNEIAEGINPYTIGGQYGEIFDSQSNNVELTAWTMFEMNTLMNLGSAAVTPALDYLFKVCEKKFTGVPTLLVLDEAWFFFKNEIFAKKIVEWLKVLRKKHVFVVFATQEIEDATNSEIASTLISQCPTKIFLADENATTELSYASYKKFGLEDSEIKSLTYLRRKRDYFYKSNLGSREFSLGLDKLQLAILTSQIEETAMLDKIEEKYGKNTGVELVEQVLKAKNIEYKYLVPEVFNNGGK